MGAVVVGGKDPAFMKSAFLVLCAAVLAVSAHGGDWRETLQPKAPGNFPPLRPLKITYKCGWAAVNAGHAEAEFACKDGFCTLHVTGGTTGLVRKLWKMDSTGTSTVQGSTLLPAKLVQTEQYSDEKRTTTVVFTPEGAERTRVREPKNKDSGKTKKFKYAPMHDLHSALLFIRSQPLKQGEIVRLVAYPSADAYLVEVEVLGREKLKTAGKEWPAIKVALRLKKITKQLALEPHQKFKRATGWFSDDTDRLLLKIEAEVMVGKVWLEMERVEFE